MPNSERAPWRFCRHPRRIGEVRRTRRDMNLSLSLPLPLSLRLSGFYTFAKRESAQYGSRLASHRQAKSLSARPTNILHYARFNVKSPKPPDSGFILILARFFVENRLLFFFTSVIFFFLYSLPQPLLLLIYVYIYIDPLR